MTSLFTFIVWRNDDFTVPSDEVLRFDMAIGAGVTFEEGATAEVSPRVRARHQGGGSEGRALEEGPEKSRVVILTRV